MVMPTMSKTIVMIHLGGLGDVLLAVPAMVRLRTRFPSHWLVLCAEEQVAKLLLACRIVDAWTSVQGRNCAGLFTGAGLVTGQVRVWLEDCDLAIAWTDDFDGKLSETLKAVGAREVITRSPFSATIRARHQRDRFLEAINEAPSGDAEDILLTVTEPLFRLGRICLEAASCLPGQSFVVIHPGSGSIHKCVALETLASVVAAVQMSGATPVLLEGPADQEQVDRLLPLCGDRPIVLKGLDLLTVAGVLARAHFFVGQDSGITHLAGLMGMHTVALFGPTDPDRWAPQGAHVAVMQGAPCLCSSWSDVSRCHEKSCLKIQQSDLVAHCVVRIEETAARQKILSGCLVTDHPVMLK
jgi:ADP-heptose:LPS heptosyltransferase